jgi:hypothetical protein
MPQRSGNNARGVVIAILGFGGLLAFWSAPPANSAEMTPAQTVAYRFPANWSPSGRGSPAPAQPTGGGPRALANLMFDPTPAYGLASASSTPVVLPERASAYADPAADGSAERKHDVTGSVDRAGKPHAAKAVSAILNDAQIASIKARLRLTADQERYWPAVEAALRNITYKKDGPQKGRLATVDPNSPAVQQLKAAAMPLLMSFTEEQKNEVRQLARLMGLDQVAQAF